MELKETECAQEVKPKYFPTVQKLKFIDNSSFIKKEPSYTISVIKESFYISNCEIKYKEKYVLLLLKIQTFM